MCSPPAFLRPAQAGDREPPFTRDRQLVFPLQAAESSQPPFEPAFWKPRNNSVHFQIDKSHFGAPSSHLVENPGILLRFWGLS